MTAVISIFPFHHPTAPLTSVRKSILSRWSRSFKWPTHYDAIKIEQCVTAVSTYSMARLNHPYIHFHLSFRSVKVKAISQKDCSWPLRYSLRIFFYIKFSFFPPTAACIRHRSQYTELIFLDHWFTHAWTLFWNKLLMRTSLVKIFSIVKSIVIDFHSLSMQFWSSVVFVGPHLYSVEASLTKQTSFIISHALAHWGSDELFMRTNLSTQTRTKK